MEKRLKSKLLTSILNLLILGLINAEALALDLSCPAGQTCVGFSSSEQARIASVSSSTELASLAHSWLWQGEDTMKELFQEVVRSDSLSRIFTGSSNVEERYMRCIQSSVMQVGGTTPTPTTRACQTLFDRVNRAAPEFNARMQTAARHVMFSSVALNSCSNQPSDSALACLPGSPSRQQLEAFNQRMANGIPIALGDGASTDTSFDVFVRGRPTLRDLREQSDPNSVSTDDLTVALTLREPEGVGRRIGGTSAPLGESASTSSDSFGTSDGFRVPGGYEAEPITNCPLIEGNPFLCEDERGTTHPVNETLRNQLLALYSSMRNPLLDMASRYLAVGTITGYFNRMMLMPHINPSNIAGVAVAIRTHCLPAGGPLYSLVNGTASAIATELENQGAAFRANQEQVHNSMLADAVRLHELSQNLEALNADFPGDIEGLSSVWPAWLPGGMTLARLVDLGVVSLGGLAEHNSRPCGFFRGGGIAAMATERLGGGIAAAPDTPLSTSSGDRFLRERGVVSAENPGNEYERCEAKRRLIELYANEMSEIFARSPALAESRVEDGDVPIFRAIAQAGNPAEPTSEATLAARRRELTEGLGANFHRISNDLNAYIENLCAHPRDEATALFTDQDSLNRLFNCGGLAPLPVDLDNPTTVGIDGRPLSRECLDLREMAPAACMISQVEGDRDAVQNFGLQQFAVGMDIVGIAGMGLGLASTTVAIGSSGFRSGIGSIATGLLEHMANPASFAGTAAAAGIGVGLGLPSYYSAIGDRREATACFYAGTCSRERYDLALTAAREAEEHLIRDALIGVLGDAIISHHIATPDAPGGGVHGPEGPDTPTSLLDDALPGTVAVREASRSPASTGNLADLRAGDILTWRDSSGVEVRATLDSYNASTGEIVYSIGEPPRQTRYFLQDLIDDNAGTSMRFIRGGVTRDVMFDLPVESMPRFQQVLTRLHDRYNTGVSFGAEGQAEIAAMMQARGITDPASFPTAVFIPGREPNIPPRIILGANATVDSLMHEVRHLSQWTRAMEGQGGAMGEVTRLYNASTPDSPLHFEMRQLSSDFDEIDAYIYNRHLLSLAGNISETRRMTALIDDMLVRSRRLAERLPEGSPERSAALAAVESLEHRRAASLSAMPEFMRSGSAAVTPPPVVTPTVPVVATPEVPATTVAEPVAPEPAIGGTRVSSTRGRRPRAPSTDAAPTPPPSTPIRAESSGLVLVSESADRVFPDLIEGDSFHFADGSVRRVSAIDGRSGTISLEGSDGSVRTFSVDDLASESGLRFESSRSYARARPSATADGGVRLGGGSVTMTAPTAIPTGTHVPTSLEIEIPAVDYRLSGDPVGSAREYFTSSGRGTLGEPFSSGGTRRVFSDPGNPNRVVKVYDPSLPGLAELSPDARQAHIAGLIQRELAIEDMMVRVRQSYIDRGLDPPFEIARIDRNPELLSRGIIVQDRMTGNPLSALDAPAREAVLSTGVGRELSAFIATYDDEIARLFEERLRLNISNAENPRMGIDVGGRHENIMTCSAGGRPTLCLFDF